eukprot:EG_transcript_20505
MDVESCRVQKRWLDFADDVEGPAAKRHYADPEVMFYLARLPFPDCLAHSRYTPTQHLSSSRSLAAKEEPALLQKGAHHPTPGHILHLKQASILRYLAAADRHPIPCPMELGTAACLCGSAASKVCSYCGHTACKGCAVLCGRCGDTFCSVCSQVYYRHRVTQHYCLNCIQLIQ